MPSESLLSWLEGRRGLCDMTVQEIPWQHSGEWRYREGALQHKSGGFFSIVGVEATAGGRPTLRQPLINQPEVGILGFLLQHRGGEPHLLIQAKPEPGNIGLSQAAPSVQATRSNYKRLHHGKPTAFLQYFTGDPAATVRADSLQSEQGTRFLGKYNRNMTVELPAALELDLDDAVYRWAPVREVCALLVSDFQINTDARSVLASSDWSALAGGDAPFSRCRGQGGFGEALLRSYGAGPAAEQASDGEILQRLEQLRAAHPFAVATVPLDDQVDWLEGRQPRLLGPAGSFDVRQVAVSSSEREVHSWDQPIVAQEREGTAVLLAREFGGVLHLLFRGRAEIGFREGFQYGPALQDAGGAPSPVPELDAEERLLEAIHRRATPVLSNLHSDEGGRFYRSVARYSIALLDPADELPVSPSLSWMTLAQIARLVKRQGVFSNEARSLISMLLAYL
ncbi:NDP-hexose 2,3-dehydratase family protein [Cyanobium sp. NIES-981]|uniref:NDP-hexose 2,3-dehydratase family protein n=1 Tax=Cyanobium sp. NIES-981 TaxID=1851505 RepID=UPI0007DCE0B3|nr:NDP-hexose 2,3-dehydratase family protein [Cyanobium sp. NIES-981]SBO44004.1 dTDP-4-keto-6-deoxy-L-hexose2,3-dehydratase [Cyanobium sp. NIES-981]